MEFDDGPIAIVDPQIDNGPVAIVDPQIDDGPVAIVDPKIDDGPVAIVDLHYIYQSHNNNASVLKINKIGWLEGAMKLKCDPDLGHKGPMLGIVFFHRAKRT